MFESAKADLAAFERRVDAALMQLETGTRALRTEVASIDQTLLQPLEKLKASIAKTRAAVLAELQKVRTELQQLVPPR